MRDAEWIEPHLVSAGDAIEAAGGDRHAFRKATLACLVTAEPVVGLPRAGCSFDFKASNLVFSPKPTLVDPDHAARMPRLYDLAVALLLFHCDLSTAPGRLWKPAELAIFLRSYAGHVTFTDAELAAWPTIQQLAWLDQGVWLLGNWPEGWADVKDRAYLLGVAAFDPAVFPLTPPDQTVSG